MANNRRRHVEPKTEQHMFIVAGLPRAVHASAIKQLEAASPSLIFKGSPSPNEGALYSPALIESLIRQAGEFAVRRLKGAPGIPTPASITLLFVPSCDQERLLEAFDFVVMSAPMAGLVAWQDGRQLRHDLQAAIDEITSLTRPAADVRANLNTVKGRLNRQSDNEAMLLPPNNFHTKEGDLVPTLRSYRLGLRSWTDRLADFGPDELTSDDVPRRIAANQTRRPFVDERGMAFFAAHPTAYDGQVREVAESDALSSLVTTLRSLYRFGGALPRGFHHDVQRSDGSALSGAQFVCSVKGRIQSTAEYANIYPNDFIRANPYRELE